MSERVRVVLLGSTGSIGTQALELIAANPDRFEVVGLGAGGSKPDLLAQQARDFGVSEVAVGEEECTALARATCDVVLNAMTGAVGLQPTLAALEQGTTLALANKESLIIGGPLVKELAAPGQLVPVDSEHSAIAQALRGERMEDVSRLVLTASGGPFRGRSRAELTDVTPTQASAHPTWDMGPVITINSATLVNKGLEVIEAHLLFDIDFDRIAVAVHPTSVVHSMVEFVDGSTMAQASPPDMRLPIALGLAWPHRISGAVAPCDWSVPTDWHFEPLDEEAFGAVRLARLAGQHGRTAPAVFNAANEVCVQAFVDGELSFLGITDTIEAVLTEHVAADSGVDLTIETVLSADAWARSRAIGLVGAH
jgi:1-deoxy-D-xylulose-5-phosphate reductoisomerase